MKGQTAIVTGGAKGIGKAIALGLAKKGCNIVINYNSSSAAAEETAKEIRALGVEALCVQANVSKSEDCKKLFEEALTLTGKVEILVNNAGITNNSNFIDLQPEDYERVINVCNLNRLRDSSKLRDNYIIEDDGFNISGGERQKKLEQVVSCSNKSYQFCGFTVSKISESRESFHTLLISRGISTKTFNK